MRSVAVLLLLIGGKKWRCERCNVVITYDDWWLKILSEVVENRWWHSVFEWQIDFLTLSGYFWNLQSETAMSFKLRVMTLKKFLIGSKPLPNRWKFHSSQLECFCRWVAWRYDQYCFVWDSLNLSFICGIQWDLNVNIRILLGCLLLLILLACEMQWTSLVVILIKLTPW